MPIASPCTGVCRIDPASGWCLGCQRSIDEIVAWASLDDAGKRRIWKLLPQRRQALTDTGDRPPGANPLPPR